MTKHARAREVRVDRVVAHEVAAAYLDAAHQRDARTLAAFAQLVNESDRLFHWITRPARPRPLQVFFTTCATPYRDAHELINSVAECDTLEVTTVAVDRDRRHPLMGNDRGGEYDRFRAVHDVLGHARLRLGFDRDGEFAVWLAQQRFHGPLARWALGTELHGQHSVRWTTGEIAQPKAMLLERTLLRRARTSGSQVQPDGEDPAADHDRRHAR